jgi:ribosomal protein S18 acetylase RimI-like enzyme
VAEQTEAVGAPMSSDAFDDGAAARCHLNCIEYAREGARWSGAAGRIEEAGGMLLIATGSDFPVVANAAFRLDPSVPADEAIDRADAWFGAMGRGWSLGTTSWADGDADLMAAAADRGLMTVMDLPAMVCHERLADAVAPDGIELRALRTDDEIAAYVAMSDAAYTSLGLPAAVLSAMIDQTAGHAPPHVVSVCAFEGDELLSGAQVAFSHGIAGIYLVGTAEAARGRGLAELVTRAATNLGFDGGAPYVTLQASPMGEPIYRRMGYVEHYRYATHARFV